MLDAAVEGFGRVSQRELHFVDLVVHAYSPRFAKFLATESYWKDRDCVAACGGLTDEVHLVGWN